MLSLITIYLRIDIDVEGEDGEPSEQIDKLDSFSPNQNR